MKVLLAVLILLAGAYRAVAQPNSAVPKNIRAANTLDYLFDANGLASFENLYGIALEPGTVMGNTYLNPEWRRTTLMLYDGGKMLEGYSTRYEIDAHLFEIQTNGGIRVLDAKRVKSFVWLDSLTNTPHYFVNARDFIGESPEIMSGFFEVLTEGTLGLLGRTYVVVKKPTYNEKLDIGVRDTRIEKRTDFYYLQNDKVKELPSNRKKLLSIFGELAGEMEKFAKDNGVSYDRSDHLCALFEHYNRLTVTN